MKQKYTVSKNEQNNDLVIQEFSELDKDIFSMTCQETYPAEKIEAAITKGKEALMSVLRTPQMFPIETSAAVIVESVIDLYSSQSDESSSRELLFNDMDLLKEVEEEPVPEIESEDEPVEIDSLLSEDVDETDLEDNEIDKITYPIKIADDDSVDTEDDI